MAPQFVAAAKTLTQLCFVKVDMEASPESGARHHIRSIPAMPRFRHGQEIARRNITAAFAPSARALEFIEVWRAAGPARPFNRFSSMLLEPELCACASDSASPIAGGAPGLINVNVSSA